MLPAKLNGFHGKPYGIILQRFEYKKRFGWVFRELLPSVHFYPHGLMQEDDYLSDDDHHFSDSGNRKTTDILNKILKR